LKWFVITAKKNFEYDKRVFKTKKEAEKYYKKEKKKHKKVTLFKHKDFKKPDRQIKGVWCPICGKNRKFKTHPEKNVKVCTYCGISEYFYYVRKYNYWL
jgi:hypothetical protein